MNVALLALFVITLVPLMPTEVTLIGMGVAASHGQTTLLTVIAVAAVAGMASDQLLYAVGRYGGPRLLGRLRRRPKVDSGVQWLDSQLRRHPLPVLVVSRWLPSGGTVGSLLAGSLRWPRAAFFSASAIGVIMWTSYATLLGYIGGEVVEQPVLSLLFSLVVATVLGSGIAIVARRAERPAPEPARPVVSLTSSW